jgi:hypothetical protein
LHGKDWVQWSDGGVDPTRRLSYAIGIKYRYSAVFIDYVQRKRS